MGEASKAKPGSVGVTWQQLGAMEASRQKTTQSDLCLSWTKLPKRVELIDLLLGGTQVILEIIFRTALPGGWPLATGSQSEWRHKYKGHTRFQRLCKRKKNVTCLINAF